MTNNHTLRLPVAEAAQLATGWWREHHMLTDLHAERIQSLTDQITTEAASLGNKNVAGMIASSTSIIRALTGVRHPYEFTNAQTSHEVNATRNVIAAVISACEQATTDQADPLTLIDRLPLVAKRSGGVTRPLEDDEILLCRSHAMLCSTRGGKQRIPAVRYVLAEAGARPVETTMIRPIDFDDLTTPTRFHAPGTASLIQPRTLTLNAWSQPVAAALLDSHLAIHSTATYERLAGQGIATTASGYAAAAGVLARALRRSGIGTTAHSKSNPNKIKGHEPEATSIVRWRVAKTAAANGPIEALRTMGRWDPRTVRLGVLHDFIGHTEPERTDTAEEYTQSFKGL